MSEADGVTVGRKTPDIEEVLQRARDEESALRDSESREQRSSLRGRKASSFETPVLRANRKVTRRRVSTFNIIVVLFLLSIAIVLYISNIIAVNHLAAEIGALESRYNKIINAQGVLQAEINRKASMERIGRIASEKLGMHFPQGQTRWIALDTERLERVTTR